MSAAASARPPGGLHPKPELMSVRDQQKGGALGLTIIHRPGLELSRLSPQNIGGLLFDDILWAKPRGLVEIDTVRSLADAGVLVVCGGGGGVPVVRSATGELTGVEAVVDKDLTAAELAITLNADRLLVLTDAPAIIRDYGTPDARPIQAIDTAALSGMTFPAGSMGPEVEACIRFATATSQPTAIGALTDAADILAGRAGTIISAAPPP